MGKKLAVIFPEIGYSIENPLFYYSKKVLLKNGYEVINISYTDFVAALTEKENLNVDFINATPSNKKEKEEHLKYVAIMNEYVNAQLEEKDLSSADKLVFLSKSVGSVAGAVYAKQKGISPYQIMITPVEYALQMIEDDFASVFCGDEDRLVNYEETKRLCQEKGLNFYEFKGSNHYLETGDIELDVENIKRYLTMVDDIVSDLDVSIYDFDIVCQNQLIRHMSEYKDKVLLIVNTATGCGFTPQYKDLEELYRQYNNQGFEILDFPCNQFGNQAEGTDAEIHSFCSSRYGISFEQFSKICVNGERESELYKYLKMRKGFKGFDLNEPGGVFLANKLEKADPDYALKSDIKWNFTKFIVNRKGQVIERFEPTVEVGKIEEAIKPLL